MNGGAKVSKPFEFADFVDEFSVDVIVYDALPGRYELGKWVPGAEVPRTIGAIILPLSDDELAKEANGRYTSKDRKLYTKEPFKKGQKVERKGQEYIIDGEKDYSDYADVFIYFAKGVEV